MLGAAERVGIGLPPLCSEKDMGSRDGEDCVGLAPLRFVDLSDITDHKI